MNIKMSSSRGTTSSVHHVKYARVKSSVLAPVSLDPVLQHMSAWHLCQHERIIQRAQPRERAHVNPGRNNKRPTSRQQQISSTNFSKEYEKASKLLAKIHRPAPDTTNQHRGPILMYPDNLRRHNNQQPILRWQAHIASHARQTPEQQPSFHPQILDTKATSRLLQSRNYQQPRRKNRHNRINNLNEIPPQQERNIVPKLWPVPSLSSSSGDSAYEPGGSSPPSRGSTPPCNLQDSCSNNSSPASSQQSQRQVSDVCALPCASPELMAQQTEQDFTPSQIQPLPRNDDLEYAMFENELMTEILTCGVVTNSALKQLCRSHLAVNHGRLQQDKMEDIIKKLQETLDIPEDDDLDLTNFGLGGGRTEMVLSTSETYCSPPLVQIDNLEPQQQHNLEPKSADESPSQSAEYLPPELVVELNSVDQNKEVSISDEYELNEFESLSSSLEEIQN